MFPVMVLALMLLAPGSSPLASAQQSPDASAAPPPQQASSNTNTEEKLPSAKPRKIYTNDDLKGSGENDNFGSMPPGMDQINDCNTNCFEQIRAFSRIDANANPNWRHDALAAVELVRSDGEWQRYLRDFYNAQFKLCVLNYDRNMDMAHTVDPRNVTPQEIVLAEKYDAKLKELQNELQALRVRGISLQRRFNTNRMADQFSRLQISWVASVYFYRVQYMVPR